MTAARLQTVEALGSRVSLLSDSEELHDLLRQRLGFCLATGRAEFVVEARFEPPPPRVAVGGREWSLAPGAAAEQAFGALFRALIDGVDEALILHAAALVRDGRGVLLAGPSGSGKTTLTLALIERGFRLLSDDFAPLDRRSGRIQPFLKSAGVRPGAARELVEAVGRGPDDTRRHLPWDELLPGSVETESAPATHVVLIADPRIASDPRSRYAFSVTCAGDPDTVRRSLLDREGIRELGTAGAEIVVEIDPRRLDARELDRWLDATASELLEYGVVASLEHDRQREPEMTPVPPSQALIMLAREVQNRRPEGRLMEKLAGDALAIYRELAALLGHVESYRLVPGDPRRTAALVDDATSATAHP